MRLHEYLKQKRGRQAALAKALGAHASDISRWATGIRPIPLEYGAPIELATDGQVCRKDEWPNDYLRYWPELATEEAAHE